MDENVLKIYKYSIYIIHITTLLLTVFVRVTGETTVPQVCCKDRCFFKSHQIFWSILANPTKFSIERREQSISTHPLNKSSIVITFCNMEVFFPETTP